jgi:hypothetical protein
MFLIGGPAFSGTTLLAHLLNQGSVLCLDEPDFHNPEQSHRGIPFLKELFPDSQFPERPGRALDYGETVNLIEECERVISPYDLGIKTCGWIFMEYAKVYRRLGYPIVVIVRDIRDALVRPLPGWVTEKSLNDSYRLIWNALDMVDLWVRYEDLVANPQEVMAKISEVLSYDFKILYTWDSESVHHPMFKLDRHDLLRDGIISCSRVGVWKTCGKTFSEETRQTAKMMGY